MVLIIFALLTFNWTIWWTHHFAFFLYDFFS